MPIIDYLKISLNSLKANKLRTFLAALGIVIGIGAVVLIVSMGEGAKALILNQLNFFGSKAIIVLPGKLGEKPGPQNVLEFTTNSLKERDALAIQRQIHKI